MIKFCFKKSKIQRLVAGWAWALALPSVDLSVTSLVATLVAKPTVFNPRVCCDNGHQWMGLPNLLTDMTLCVEHLTSEIREMLFDWTLPIGGGSFHWMPLHRGFSTQASWHSYRSQISSLHHNFSDWSNLKSESSQFVKCNFEKMNLQSVTMTLSWEVMGDPRR